MDILSITQFQNSDITIYGTYYEPFFQLTDISNLFGIDITDISKLDDDYKVHVNDEYFLSEDGLSEVLSSFEKPIVKEFKKWFRGIIKQICIDNEKELSIYKEKTYEEIRKSGHIYVIKTDGGYKVGKSRDVGNRIKGIQTGNVRDIEILLNFRTSNSDLLEKVLHYILDRYRCNSNREFFDCDIEYIKSIVTLLGNTIDTLKSTYQHITKDELINKMNERVGIKINDPPEYSDSLINQNTNDNPFYKWLDENIEYKQGGLLQINRICMRYLNVENIHSSVATKYKKDIEKYIRENYRNIKWQYGAVRINDICYHGWKHLSIRE